MIERSESGGGWVFEPGVRPSLPVEGVGERFPVGRVWCVGRNYAAHAAEMEPDRGRKGEPDPPFFFLKPATALVPGGGDIPYPPGTSQLHHEVELVVALRSGGRDIPPHEALEGVFGYAVGVDLTLRDLQAAAKAAGRPWSLAKGFDRSAPCSPIRSARRIGHPSSGGIRAAVNGRLRQDGDLSEQIWPVPLVLSQLSRSVRLMPGDLVFTGTPAGVGPLVPGDRLVAEIERVGRLEVRIMPPV